MKVLDGEATAGRLSVENAFVLEDVIYFMQNAFSQSSPHKKPVLIHSLRIALQLEADGEPLPVVIAALLHDLIEDTLVTKQVIREKYGEEIAGIVSANSYNRQIQDPKERDIEMYSRCKEAGKEACLVKAADLYDNSLYFFPRELERSRWFREKILLFAEISAPFIEHSTAWRRLNDRAKQLASNNRG